MLIASLILFAIAAAAYAGGAVWWAFCWAADWYNNPTPHIIAIVAAFVVGTIFAALAILCLFLRRVSRRQP